MTKKLTPREKLRAAIDRACVARGQATRITAIRERNSPLSINQPADDVKDAWAECASVERALEHALTAYTRAIRQEARKKR